MKEVIRQKTLADAYNAIARLENENAELKEKNNFLTKKCECLTNCNDSLQDLLSDDIKTLEQLIKVKEIIKGLIKNAPNTYSGTDIMKQQSMMFRYQDYVNRAEQFLGDEK